MGSPLNPYWTQKEAPGFGTGQGTDVNRLHDYDDVDTTVLSHHHTLGPLSTQSSSGNHSHNGVDSNRIGLIARVSALGLLAAAAAVGVELKDTGIGDVKWTPTNKGIYTLKYKARAQIAVAAPNSNDFIIRYAVYPASPSNVSPILEAVTVPLNLIGGAGSAFFICEGLIICPDDITAGVAVNVACFYKDVAGAGSTLQVGATAGSKRQFSIRLDGWK